MYLMITLRPILSKFPLPQVTQSPIQLFLTDHEFLKEQVSTEKVKL